MRRAFALSSFLFFVSGCATSFMGSAYFEGGRGACEKKCAAGGLQMTGMVYMGEYSSACVCELPRPAAAPSGAVAPAASGAAAVGVIMQMRRAEEAQNRSMMSMQAGMH